MMLISIKIYEGFCTFDFAKLDPEILTRKSQTPLDIYGTLEGLGPSIKGESPDCAKWDFDTDEIKNVGSTLLAYLLIDYLSKSNVTLSMATISDSGSCIPLAKNA